jgi:cytosine/adenosine deaminase-related metal-dependent hydrolase
MYVNTRPRWIVNTQPRGVMKRSNYLLPLLLLSLSAQESPAAAQTAEGAAEGTLVLQGFRVVPMTSARPLVLESTSVLVRDGVIEQVKPRDSLDVPEGALIIEGDGRTLLPGLIDMHVHVWDEAELLAYLKHGVTTIRNASGMPFHLELSERIAKGALIGPRLVTTGPILNSPGPNTQVNHQLVETAEDARRAVRQQHEQGYRHLKVYSNLTRDADEAILEEARSLGMSIMGHTPEGIREPGMPHERPFTIDFLDVLDDGFVTIEHMESIVWHGLGDALDGARARRLARRISQAEVTVSPTLLAHRNLIEVARSAGGFLDRGGVETLNPFITEFEEQAFKFWSNQPRNARHEFDAFYLEAVRLFHEEGVVLVAGTDAGIFTNLPGRSLVRELEMYSDAGLDVYEVLKTATTNAATALGLGQSLGRVAVGYSADLIVADEDPLAGIDRLRTVSGVVSNGRWLDVGDLQQLWSQQSPASYERTRQRVLAGLAAQGGGPG